MGFSTENTQVNVSGRSSQFPVEKLASRFICVTRNSSVSKYQPSDRADTYCVGHGKGRKTQEDKRYRDKEKLVPYVSMILNGSTNILVKDLNQGIVFLVSIRYHSDQIAILMIPRWRMYYFDRGEKVALVIMPGRVMLLSNRTFSLYWVQTVQYQKKQNDRSKQQHKPKASSDDFREELNELTRQGNKVFISFQYEKLKG